ncbi:hypothetical protein RhiirC2_746101, partial [Rhizophagus irregularis]
MCQVNDWTQSSNNNNNNNNYNNNHNNITVLNGETRLNSRLNNRLCGNFLNSQSGNGTNLLNISNPSRITKRQPIKQQQQQQPFKRTKLFKSGINTFIPSTTTTTSSSSSPSSSSSSPSPSSSSITTTNTTSNGNIIMNNNDTTISSSPSSSSSIMPNLSLNSLPENFNLSSSPIPPPSTSSTEDFSSNQFSTLDYPCDHKIYNNQNLYTLDNQNSTQQQQQQQQ